MTSTVLLIDDVPEMATLVGVWLEDLGADVILASTVEEGLAAAAHLRLNAILLDISLGDEDGLLQLPRLRSQPGLSEVPVVVFSVHDSRRREALEAGAAAFVRKPFEGADLLAAMQPYLEE